MILQHMFLSTLAKYPDQSSISQSPCQLDHCDHLHLTSRLGRMDHSLLLKITNLPNLMLRHSPQRDLSQRSIETQSKSKFLAALPKPYLIPHARSSSMHSPPTLHQFPTVQSPRLVTSDTPSERHPHLSIPMVLKPLQAHLAKARAFLAVLSVTRGSLDEEAF